MTCAACQRPVERGVVIVDELPPAPGRAFREAEPIQLPQRIYCDFCAPLILSARARARRTRWA